MPRYHAMALALAVTTFAASCSGGTGDGAPAPPPTDHDEQAEPAGVPWRFDHEAREWVASGDPPRCPDPLTLITPVDVALVTGALWPGQVRGDGYRAHGGFRFDGRRADAVTVVAPLDAFLVAASSYLEQGERQYFAVFIAPCGISYRLDHLLEPSPALAAALEAVPQAGEGDSRTTPIEPPTWFEAGDVVATAVGLAGAGNIFVDFGVYDLRRRNQVASDPAWLAEHVGEEEFSHHGLCIWDLLSPRDAEILRALPTGNEGKASDYCG